MSDDEENVPKLKKQRIHFGSLEEGEKERLASDAVESSEAGASEDVNETEEVQDPESALSAAVLAGIKAGNINISEGKYRPNLKRKTG